MTWIQHRRERSATCCREHGALEFVWIRVGQMHTLLMRNFRLPGLADKATHEFGDCRMGWVTPLGTGVDSVWENCFRVKRHLRRRFPNIRRSRLQRFSRTESA